MGVEWENAREALRLAKKDTPSHVTLVLGLYALSCKERELGQVARASYFFMRQMDDILDGDLQIRGNPLALAQSVRQQIESEDYNDKLGLAVLAKYSIDALRVRARSSDDPKGDFLQAVDSMIFDHERSKERKALTQQDLDDHYWKSFSPVVNLLLIGFRSKLRASDIPTLSIAQGRLYALRDIQTDWPRGTINVPQEVLSESRLSPSSSLDDLKSNPCLQEWFKEECRSSINELAALQEFLVQNGETLTNTVCGRITKWMIRFAKDNSTIG